mgnify:CR=1 FL=1
MADLLQLAIAQLHPTEMAQGLALLIVVITGITRPIPKASTAVPRIPKSITNGTLRFDCFG